MFTITIHVEAHELSQCINYLVDRYGGPVEVNVTIPSFNDDDNVETQRTIKHWERMTQPTPYEMSGADRSMDDEHIARRNYRRAERQRREYPLSLNTLCPTCPATEGEPCLQGDMTVASRPHAARLA